DGDTHAAVGQLALQLQSGHARYADIENQAPRLAVVGREELRGRGERPHRAAEQLPGALQRPADGRVVVHHENRRFRAHERSSRYAGSARVNSAPPSTPFAVSLPPWASAAERL